jgi:hypothetical protein
MASEATINLALELLKLGVSVYQERKGAGDRDLDEMKVSEAVTALRKMRVRSVDELVEEGRRQAGAGVAGEEDDGA